MMKFEVTYTDTFSGEVNFGWVRRADIVGTCTCILIEEKQDYKRDAGLV